MAQFPEWATHPIPGVSLSAGGLLALADLSTVAQRTVITGGSTWLDSLLLAPGLHYQQAADELARRSGANPVLSAVEQVRQGRAITFTINNAATASYIQRIARPGETVTLHVGFRLRRSPSGNHATIWAATNLTDIPDLGWLSHLLYLISPILTIAAIVLTILLRDWWALGSLIALMLSRILNIYVIKQRTILSHSHSHSPKPPAEETSGGGSSTPVSSSSSSHQNHDSHRHRLTEWIVSLSDGRSPVKLRGTPDDVRAITADAWLRHKTAPEGYLEAAAKLIVFLVAAVSGNMTQAGALVMMALLLTTAGLLALSNANAKSFYINGRKAVTCSGSPSADEPQGEEEEREKKGGKGVVVDGRVIPQAEGTGDGIRADDMEKGLGLGYSSENTAV